MEEELLELVRLNPSEDNDDITGDVAKLEAEFKEELEDELITELIPIFDDDVEGEDGGTTVEEASVREAGVDVAMELDELEVVGSPEIARDTYPA